MTLYAIIKYTNLIPNLESNNTVTKIHSIIRTRIKFKILLCNILTRKIAPIVPAHNTLIYFLFILPCPVSGKAGQNNALKEVPPMVQSGNHQN